MEQIWEYNYSLMKAELSRSKTMEVSETEQTERYYRTAFSFWEKVKSFWQEKLTYTEEEEINFFRIVKPQFTSHIEYYLILSQGLLFIPNDPSEAVGYWVGEAKRYKRFCDRHDTFIRYMESNNHYRDRDYFLRKNNRTAILPQERIYNDEDCRTSHDWLVRSYKANKMYYDYVQKRLEVLEHG